MTESRTSSNSQRRRAALLDAAEKLIVREGYDSVKLRDIALEAEVSIGLLQHYFRTRDDLMREAMSVASSRRISRWTRSAEGAQSDWERLSTLLARAVDDTYRSSVWLELCAASTHHPELRDDVEAVQQTWRQALLTAIKSGVNSGEFAPIVSPDKLTDILVNLIDGKLLEIATLSRRPSTAEWTDTTLHLARHLLGAASQRSVGNKS